MKKIGKWFKNFVLPFAFLISMLVLIAYITLFFISTNNDWCVNNNWAIANELGGFVGGYIGTIVLIVTVFLLYLTLKSQKEAFGLQQFENKFFDLLKIHRGNVEEMELQSLHKRKVFSILRLEYQEIYDIVKKYYTYDDKYNQNKANISYIIFFFGARDSGKELALELLKNKCDATILYKIFNELKKHPSINNLSYLKEFLTAKDYKPFNGHQSRLSHYFRHLYQAVKFVDNQPEKELSLDEKTYYVKTLRAQLSNHELALFFYNSISDLGKNWRLNIENSDDSYITRYQFLKNIPLSVFTFDLHPENFYKLEYEWYEIQNSLPV